jgi:retron-type reverse transcriptase
MCINSLYLGNRERLRVRPAFRRCEADEQSRTTGGGAGGAKDGDQGKRGTGRHVPDTEPRTRRRVKRPGPRTESGKGKEKEKFTALLHHITVDSLEKAFRELRKDAAPGIDGVTWENYETDLGRKLGDLHSRVHRGAYRAQPNPRVFIPEPDGRQRPLAIAALEDKIVQRATASVLNAIYEEDFLGFSYGFRPERGAHDAMDALVVGITTRKVNWIFDADIEKVFDSVSQDWLLRFVEHRIGDERIIRLIRKWLKAGVLEDEAVTVSDTGTGQGSVISPLLANVYLH